MWAWLWLACGTPDPVTPDPTLVDPTNLTDQPTTPPGAPTFWGDVQPITSAHCAGCHRPGDIGPFSLETYDEAFPWADAIAASVDAGTMPPWPPAADCAPLVGPLRLPDADRDVLTAWADAGAPEGDPADAVSPVPPAPFVADLTLEMSEAYTPRAGGDDYRCFVVEWPETERKYVVSYQVVPERREMVHHVIMYMADGSAANQARSMDAQSAGPGYSCFGSSGVLADTLGAWVPGIVGVDLPPRTGVAVEPGSVLIVQMHYNTSAISDPPSDKTEMAFVLEDTVEKPASQLLVLDPLWLIPGVMSIPAGANNVVHDATFSGSTLARMASAIGAVASEGVELHRVSLHMHNLGSHATLTFEEGGEQPSCVLDIPKWDFAWQGGYELEAPLRIGPQDGVHLWCAWDNPGPTAVDWGDGTEDEMCLAGLYVTRP